MGRGGDMLRVEHKEALSLGADCVVFYDCLSYSAASAE